MGGLIGIIANDSARYSLFSACVTKLERPEGSKLEWLIGGDWCGARNSLAQQCLDEGHDWLWFMDDDHAFEPDLLMRLLAWDKALVNPLCLARLAPFPLVTYASKAGENLYLPIDLTDCGFEGLVELEAAGCAGMLIRRGVLEAIERPWFEYTDRSEDIVFCEKAKAAGFRLWGDLNCRLGHITTAVVYPDTTPEGEWMTRLKVGGGLDLYVSPAHDWDMGEGHSEVYDEVPANPAEKTLPEKESVFGMAERIEIWMDDEMRWWWRALDGDGRIMAKDSGVSEGAVMAACQAVYPDAPIYFIAREIDDSRKPPSKETFGPSVRLWDREVR